MGIIKNKKGIILGSDTHAAQLNGSDTHAASLSGAQSAGGISWSSSPSTGSQNQSGPTVRNIGNRTVNPGSATNIVIGRFIQTINGVGGTVTYTARIRRDNITSGTIVATQFQAPLSPNFTFDLSFTDINVSNASHTYYWSVEITQTTAQAPVPFTLYTPSPNGYVFSVADSHAATLTGTDTHAAALIGVNDQTTKESGVVKN